MASFLKVAKMQMYVLNASQLIDIDISLSFTFRATQGFFSHSTPCIWPIVVALLFYDRLKLEMIRERIRDGQKKELKLGIKILNPC